MEIMACKNPVPEKSTFGDFVLKPEAGWTISYSFLDFESGLLIVTAMVEDKSKWTNNGFGSRNIPTKEYKIDRVKLRVLSHIEWSEYFNYSNIETISEDGKYTLFSQRIYDADRDNDSIKEELFETESGKLISSSTSIAFYDKKRESLLERHYKAIQQQEELQRKLDAKLSLDQYYHQELSRLKDTENILCYHSKTATFQLTFDSGKFILLEGGTLPTNFREWDRMKFEKQTIYKSLDQFWTEFSSDPKWYVKYEFLNAHGRLSTVCSVLTSYIVRNFNAARQQQQFTFDEYSRIQKWENAVWNDQVKPTEWNQWCPCCSKEVSYNPRYPKYICNICCSKEKRDKKGSRVEFYNQGVSGGLKVVFLNERNEQIREDDTYSSYDCIIEGKLYFAEEARFGGIVIQKKD